VEVEQEDGEMVETWTGPPVNNSRLAAIGGLIHGQRFLYHCLILTCCCFHFLLNILDFHVQDHANRKARLKLSCPLTLVRLFKTAPRKSPRVVQL
jgi:hypothetical protein